MPALAPELRPVEEASDDGVVVAVVEDEDADEVVLDPGIKVAVLTTATWDESVASAAGAGAWKTSDVGSLQLTFPEASSPQQFHCALVKL